MAQIRPVTSEALEAAISRILPSQAGFGEDLQATNVITPIIDLTPTAEGSNVPRELQTAISFDSNTAFNVNGSSAVIVNTAGFYRIFGVSAVNGITSANGLNKFTFSDGLSTKDLWQHAISSAGSNVGSTAIQFDFIAFLQTGDSVTANSGQNRGFMQGSTRQIADVNGVLVNPSGFSPQ